MDLNADFMHLIDATSNDFSSTFAVLDEESANANVRKACHVPDYGSQRQKIIIKNKQTGKPTITEIKDDCRNLAGKWNIYSRL